MTPDEVAKDFAERLRVADDDAILAAEAIAFGLADEYLAARKQDVIRRLHERYHADSDGGSGGAAGGSSTS